MLYYAVYNNNVLRWTTLRWEAAKAGVNFYFCLFYEPFPLLILCFFVSFLLS